MRFLLALGCCVLAAGAPRPARADPAQAQDFAARATKRVQQGDRRGAIEFLEKAYEADPSADYLLQMADQFDALALEGGDRRDIRLALAYFREYLLTEKNPIEIQTVQERMMRLRELLAAAVPEPVVPPVAEPLPPPAPSRVEKVAVDFIAENGTDPFHVTVGSQTCDTPCSLKLAPGGHSIAITGTDKLNLSVFVPNTPGMVRLKPSGNRYLVPGIILTIIGPIIAASMWSLAYSCPPVDVFPDPCSTTNLALWPLVGGIMFFTGVGFIGYAENHQVSKVDVDVAQVDIEPPKVRIASIGLQVLPGGAAAGVGLSF
jgi:hypothetical protein